MYDSKKVKENQWLVDRNMKVYDKQKGVRVGDFVKDKDGKVYRIAYIWRDEHNKPFAWQTEDGSGSFYLGNGYMSMSGSLNSGFQEGSEFKQIGTKMGSCWVFDNDFAGAGRGVDTNAKFRLFRLIKGENQQ